MRPEDVFTKKSLRCYKAVRKAVNKYPAWTTAGIIPGRQKGVNGAYVEVRWGSSRRRYFFERVPTKNEVHGVIDLLIEVQFYQEYS